MMACTIDQDIRAVSGWARQAVDASKWICMSQWQASRSSPPLPDASSLQAHTKRQGDDNEPPRRRMSRVSQSPVSLKTERVSPSIDPHAPQSTRSSSSIFHFNLLRWQGTTKRRQIFIEELGTLFTALVLFVIRSLTLSGQHEAPVGSAISDPWPRKALNFRYAASCAMVITFESSSKFAGSLYRKCRISLLSSEATTLLSSFMPDKYLEKLLTKFVAALPWRRHHRCWHC